MKIAVQERWVLAFLTAPDITWDKTTPMSRSDFHADSSWEVEKFVLQNSFFLFDDGGSRSSEGLMSVHNLFLIFAGDGRSLEMVFYTQSNAQTHF